MDSSSNKNIITNIKSRFVKEVLSDFILVPISVISLFMAFVNTGTLLFFGINKDFTNVNELIVSVILSFIFTSLGMGKKVETSVNLDETEEKFIINIVGKKLNKEYNLSPSDIKCIHELKSKDVTLIFYVKQHGRKKKYKVFLNGKNIGNPSVLINSLKEHNVYIKTFDDEDTRTS